MTGLLIPGVMQLTNATLNRVVGCVPLLCSLAPRCHPRLPYLETLTIQKCDPRAYNFMGSGTIQNFCPGPLLGA
jgi:hypothetical protein